MSKQAYQARRAAFALLVQHYHNDFSGGAGGVFEHSAAFIANIVEAESPAGAAALHLDPRLTSTDIGAVAYTVAKAVSEDKQLAPDFLDLELAGDTLVAYFEEHADPEKIKRVLSEVGAIGILAKPLDRISDNVVADLFIIAVAPAKDIAEAVVADMRKRMLPEAKVVEAPAAAAVQQPVDTVPAATEVVPAAVVDADAAMCEAMGLKSEFWGAKAMEACPVTAQETNALFAEAFGAKAAEKVLDRDDMVRVLAVKGHFAAPTSLGEALDVAVGRFLVDRAAIVDQASKGKLTSEQYENFVDDLAVTIDGAAKDDALYGLFVDQIVDLRMEKLTAERKAALVERVRKAGKTVEEHQKVVARTLRAVAQEILVARGLLRNESLVATKVALESFVNRTTAPPAKPEVVVAADPLDSFVDSIIALEP